MNYTSTRGTVAVNETYALLCACLVSNELFKV